MLAFTSCNNDDENDDFASSAAIEGRIFVQNEYQQPLYEERDGIGVYLEVGFQDFTISADGVGVFQLGRAPVGNYTATYTKAGFGTVVNSGINVSITSPSLPVYYGYQRFPSATITQRPITSFEDLTLDLDAMTVVDGDGVVIDTTYTLTINATMQPAPPPTGFSKGYRLFLGRDEMVSFEDYFYQEYFNTTNAAIEIVYEDEWFVENDIQSGDVIFAALYGDANFDLTQEVSDPALVYPNISEEVGAIGSVVLP
jgi:hypothetical protein